MTTTDRELLELAAKAAGIELVDIDIIGGVYKTGPDQFCRWNPLANDGDALRLAVQLRLFPINFACIVNGEELIEVYCRDGSVLEPTAPDLNAATRRAIVRAAAEIGKEMK